MVASLEQKEKKMSVSINLSYSLKKEFFRKTIHMTSAFVPFFYYFFHTEIMILLLFVTLVYFFSEVFRLRKIKIPLISQITEIAARSRDEGKIILGPITLSMGIFLSLILFDDYRVAVIAIFALSFGDGVASLFGKLFGRYKIPFTFGKTLSGSFGCFVILFIVYLSCGLLIKQAFLLALISATVELFPTGDYDNLLIPLTTGLFAEQILL